MTSSAPRAAIIGVGRTPFGRDLGRTAVDLFAEAAAAALTDAGVDAKSVDGISTYNGPTDYAIHGAAADGIDQIGTLVAARALGLEDLRWYSEIAAGGVAVASLMHAVHAIQSGACETALVYRTLVRPKERRYGEWEATDTRGPRQFTLPYGQGNATQVCALYLRRYMSSYGLTREQLGIVPVVHRMHAVANPHAVMRTPMTLAEYLEARWIADPMCLLDCDIPVDAAVAILVTNAKRAERISSKPVFVDECATGASVSAVIGLGAIERTSPAIVAEEIWRRSGLSQSDIDIFFPYDGFSPSVLWQLEDFGFCKRGEAADFVGDGSSIALNGRLPLNTHGGMLSEGRTHGMGSLFEAVAQLRGDCGDRQVQRHQTALVVSGLLGPCAATILHR